MSGRQRIDQLERSLSALGRVRLWLDSAHAFGSLPAYVEWLIDQPASDHPGRIPIEVRDALDPKARTKRRPDRTAEAQAESAAFLISLAVETNSWVHDELVVQAARTEAAIWQTRYLRQRANTEFAADGPGLDRSEWSDWAKAVTDLWLDLATIGRVARSLGTMRFGRRPVLFPECAERLDELRKIAHRLLDLATLECPDAVLPAKTRASLSETAADDRIRWIEALCRAKVLDEIGEQEEVDQRMRRSLARIRERAQAQAPAATTP
jgi:hypothetical protein